MLQQTTVEAVRRRYADFLRRFPTLPALARARRETVLAAWSGLGYYARARNLHRAARVVVRRHRGRLPEEAAALAALPGLGPYTAGAVAALAFGTVVPVAEVNVTRVISRLYALDGSPASRAHRAAVLRHARRFLPPRRPGDGLAALMDLGQLVCRPRRPDCARCPLFRTCRSRRRGEEEMRPLPRVRPAASTLHLAAAVSRRGPRALLVRRKSGWLSGLWEFPCGEGRSLAAARRALRARCGALGLRVSPTALFRTTHTIVGRNLKISVFAADPALRGAPEGRWMTAAQAREAALPTLTYKIARAAGFLPREGGVTLER
jgi:A/G-specific adenine glycosylase